MLAWALAAGGALAQPAPAANESWQACTRKPDGAARLACFDEWARSQQAPPALASHAPPATLPPASTAAAPDAQAARDKKIADDNAAGKCRNEKLSALTRFWELEDDADCEVFTIRGYRPMSLSVISSDSVNRQPTSPSPGHTAPVALAYRNTENRIQLSVRTKVLQNVLTRGHPALRDSLWFGYTQQSYWQLFSGSLSRPFRSTDHEPEMIYIYPSQARLPGGWQLRYSGLGVVHQSNGQSLPLSRSWNRVYAMAGMEHDGGFSVQGRVWRRVPESAAKDDNPDISDFVGRAEVTAYWEVNPKNTLGVTVRHSLAANTNGSVRLEWLRAIGGETGKTSGLRFHTQLFSGYGDSLLDYNRRRTLLSVGLSLVDF